MRRKRLGRFITALLVAALAVAVVPAVAGANGATVAVAVPTARAQYSDYVLLKAQVRPVGLAGTVAFTVNSSTDGLVGGPVYKIRSGVATQRYRVPLPEGEYTIVATFTSADQLTVVQGTGTLRVRPEDARIFYTSWGGRPLPTVMPVGRNGKSAPFAVIQTIAEVPDGTPGDLLLASYAPTSALATHAAPPITSSAFRPMVLRQTIWQFPDGLETGAGIAQAELSDYYAAYGSCAFAVYDPRAGMSAGTGDLIHPITGGHVAVAFFAAPRDPNPLGAVVFGHIKSGMVTSVAATHLYGDSASSFVPLGVNGAQITFGDEYFSVQLTATEKSRQVPGSANTTGMRFSYFSELNFTPVPLLRGVIDLR